MRQWLVKIPAIVLVLFSASLASAGDRPDLQLPSRFEVGVRIRGVFVTSAMLSPYLAASTSMENVALGVEFVYHLRPSYDLVSSLDFSFLSPHDGNYLSGDGDPSLDTHFVQFRNLDFLSADVSIIGHHDFLPWLQLRYGGGLGLGVVFGDVLETNDGTQCTAQNAGDISQCYPVSPTVGPIRLGQPDTETKLSATETGQLDTAQDPHRHAVSGKPPVMAVVNLLVGVRFRILSQLSAQVEVGFRDAIFAGVGVHYHF